MKKVSLLLFAMLIALGTKAQVNITWQKTIGGSSTETGKSIINTSDGGFIILGTTESASGDGDIIINHGGKDLLLVKFDATKTIQWKKTYGGSADEDAAGIIQLNGNYQVLSTTNSNDGDVSSNHGNTDYWLLTLDSVGNILKEQTYGGSLNDVASSICTSKSGFAIAGISNSNDGDITKPLGGDDVFLIQFDSLGIKKSHSNIGNSLSELGVTIYNKKEGLLVNYSYPHLNGAGPQQNTFVCIDNLGKTIFKNKPLEDITFDGSAIGLYNVNQLTNSLYLRESGQYLALIDSTGKNLYNFSTKYEFGVKASIIKNNVSNTILTLGSLNGQIIYSNFRLTMSLISSGEIGGNGDDIINSVINFNGSQLMLGSTTSNDSVIMNNHGGSDMFLMQVCEFYKPTIVAKNNYFCTGDSLKLSYLQNINANYQWQFNGVPIANKLDSVLIIKSEGDYSVMINENGCIGKTDVFTILKKDLPNPPKIKQTGKIISCTGGNSAQLSINRTNFDDVYTWSNGITSYNSIDISNTGVYSVTVTSIFGCTNSAEFTVISGGVPTPSICIVGIDSATRHNIIVWEKPICLAVDSFIVYKEGNVGGLYERIGAVDRHVYSTFIDTGSYPQAQEYRYKLTAKDTNNVETDLSAGHKTIHLAIGVGVGGVYNLAWNNYEGFNYTTFNVYRGTTPFNLIKVASVSSNVFAYTDVNPPVGDVYYQIEIIGSYTCNPTARVNSFMSTRSNIAEHKVVTGITNIDTQKKFSMYPNPASNDITIEAYGSVEIYNVLGEKVIEKFVDGFVKVDVSGWRKGIYFVKANNLHTFQKLIVQ